MLIKGVNIQDMEQALARVNEKKYHGNLKFLFLERNGNKIHFRIKARSYDHLGYRILYSGKISLYGCWHAHGDLFESIFEIQPEAVIYSKGMTITKDCGNWEDINIGSQIFTLMFSDSCPCNAFEFMKQELGREMKSWKDFLLSIRELSENSFRGLIQGPMKAWSKIIARHCSYEQLKNFYDRSDCQAIIERRQALECPKSEIPLLIGTMKTEAGKMALEQRLKKIRIKSKD